jgi:hypothetical protein
MLEGMCSDVMLLSWNPYFEKSENIAWLRFRGYHCLGAVEQTSSLSQLQAVASAILRPVYLAGVLLLHFTKHEDPDLKIRCKGRSQGK